MPFVRIDLPAGKPREYGIAVSDAVQATLHNVFGVPLGERFHAVAEHEPGTLLIDPSYLDVQRSANALVVQITLNRGREAELKQQFYQALADALHERPGVRREDVVVSLVEVAREDWSFGNGQAQLVQQEVSR